MKLVSFTVKNFKCFGPDGSTIYFAPITLLFGRNMAGKTALLDGIKLGRDILVDGKITESLGPFPYFVHRQDVRNKITLIFSTDEGEVNIQIMWDADAGEPFVIVGATNEDVLAFVRKRMAKYVHIKDRQQVPRDFDPSTVRADDWEHGMVAWKLLAENKELLKKVNAEMKRIAEASGEDWPYTVM